MTDENPWDFVAVPLPSDFCCRSCRRALREPKLTSCCGIHFCRTCIDAVVRAEMPCPSCNESDFETFPDKNVQRKIFCMEVRCSLRGKGCMWVGPLQELPQHLDSTCQYVETECSNKCGERVLRRNLTMHYDRDCCKRKHTCQYCDYSATYEEINGSHWRETCQKYPISCPNSCGIGTVERRHYKTHVKECPLEEIECDFVYAGCVTKVLRKDIDKHSIEHMPAHLKLLSKFTINLSQCPPQVTEQDVQGKIEAVVMRSDRKIGEVWEEIHKVGEHVKQLRVGQNQLRTEIQILRESIEEVHAEHNQQETVRDLKELSIKVSHIERVQQNHREEFEETTRQLQKVNDKLTSLQIEHVQQISEKNSVLESENNVLKQKMGQLESRLAQHSLLPYDFVLPNISTYLAGKKGTAWYSPEFYTGTLENKEYRMQVAVVPNSLGGKQIMSVWVAVHYGECDDNLHWPLKATVTLQLKDATEHQQPYEKKGRCTWEKVSPGHTGNRLLWQPFILHSELANFIKDNQLHFRVVSIHYERI